MLYIIMAFLAGVSLVLSRIINFNLAEKIGVLQGTFFNYIVGLSFSLVFLFIGGSKLSVTAALSGQIPWWALLGGFLGVMVVALSTCLAARVSVFHLTILIFAGQLLAGEVIDFLLKGQLSMGKSLGGLLVVAGLTYNLFLEKNSKQA